MQTELRDHRKAWGVSLDELSAELGSGYSRARLSIIERGLIEPSPAELQTIMEAVERLGILRSHVRRVVKMAEHFDLAGIELEVQRLRECATGIGGKIWSKNSNSEATEARAR